MSDLRVGDPLPVNEFWESIQGEATYAGTPSVFIRLQGCPVGCPWCDTKYTWDAPEVTTEVDAGAMLLKSRGEASFAWLNVEQVIAMMAEYRSGHVVITGGEPAMYDLMPLTTELIEGAGLGVQIETSGTFPIHAHKNTWITVSPKLGMPGGLHVLDACLERADEIKMPIGRHEDVKTLFSLLDRNIHGGETPIWLQPLSTSQKATELCVRTATANRFKVSIQIHALAGWR